MKYNQVIFNFRDCPISTSSIFEISFSIPDICPNQIFFVALANGNGVVHNSSSSGIYFKNDVRYPELAYEDRLRDVPYVTGSKFNLKDEFKLTLRIFYDDNFKDEFGSNSKSR